MYTAKSYSGEARVRPSAPTWLYVYTTWYQVYYCCKYTVGVDARFVLFWRTRSVDGQWVNTKEVYPSSLSGFLDPGDT